MGCERLFTGGSPSGGLLSRGLGGLSSFVQNNPKGVLGAAAALSILPKAFAQSQGKAESELMKAYRDPSTVITASLDEFLEKKAAAASPFSFSNELMGGLAKGVATSIASALIGGIGTHLSNTRNILVQEPKRRALLDILFKSDPILKDAIARHPEAKAMILEAYGTMTKFAPNLSLDINATRSFLREAALGGHGVNYATIKNLVDTEKSIADNKPRYGGK